MSIEHRLLFHNCNFFQSTLHVVTIYTLRFKAKFKISLADAKHLLCIFTSKKASCNRLIYIWLPRAAERCRRKSKDGYSHGKKLRCIGNRAPLNKFQIEVKFYLFFMPSLFQKYVPFRIISDYGFIVINPAFFLMGTHTNRFFLLSRLVLLSPPALYFPVQDKTG